MATSGQLRSKWRDYKCKPNKLKTVQIRGRKLQVAPETIEAWQALSQVLAHYEYVVRKSDTGSYNCRNVGGTSTPSLHSYGIAVDINWNTNPFIRTPNQRQVRFSSGSSQEERGEDVRRNRADTDMTSEMIKAIRTIKSIDGEQVFEWGGGWRTIKDAMHFELDIGPQDLAAGIDWSTVVGGEDESSDEDETGDASTLRAYEITAGSGLRLRAGSGTEFEILDLMPFGAIIHELKREGKWSVIDRTADGAADGSAHNSFLRRREDLDLVVDPELSGSNDEGTEPPSNAEFLHFNSSHTGTDFEEDNSLSVELETAHKPHRGWKIRDDGNGKYSVSSDVLTTPLVIGRSAKYRYRSRNLTTVGLGRPWYDGTPGHIKFDPDDWNATFDNWPELIYPTAFAESGADFSVINAWDLAGFTVGLIQLAAHTSDDLIPFFRTLIDELPQESEKFFPELTVIDGKLSYRRGSSYRSIEVRAPAKDPVPNDLVDRGLFVSYFNTNRQIIGSEELHSAARWLAWTQESADMRRLQVASSIDNMRHSLNQLHVALLEDASDQYPKGVHGMRCDHLAAAIAVPHLSPRRVHKAVWALTQNDVLHAFEREIEYGPGDREKNVVKGVRDRGRKLSDLKFDLTIGHPI